MADADVGVEKVLLQSGVPESLLRRIIEEPLYAWRVAMLMRYADRHRAIALCSLAQDPSPRAQVLPLPKDPTLPPRPA